MTAERDDAGAALISVMAIGALIVLAGLWLADALVTEFRSVEDSLTEVRAYWASVGQAAYLLSRTAQSGACNGNCPAGKNNNTPPDKYQSAAQGYLQEITSGPVTMQNWLYPDVSSLYVLTMSYTVCVDPLAPAAGVAEMLLVSAAGGAAACPAAPPGNGTATPKPCPAPAPLPANTPAALRTLNAVRPVELRYCLVAPGANTCGGGPGVSSGAALVTSVHRPSC